MKGILLLLTWEEVSRPLDEKVRVTLAKTDFLQSPVGCCLKF